MVETRFTLHVGLSKAASTYLQETFFPALTDACFVHAPYRVEGEANPIQQFVYELAFRNAVSIDCERHRKAIAAYAERSGKSRLIVSAESLFGMPFANHDGFWTNTDLLARVFPDARVMLVLRRQDKWLESSYSQFLKMGLSTSPTRCTNYRDGRFSAYRWLYGGPNLDVRDLDWSRFVAQYYAVFGRENVLVQCYESFVADPSKFLAELCGFAGVQAIEPPDTARKNPSLSPVSATVARLVNAMPMAAKMQLKQWVPSQFHPAAVLNRTLDPLLSRQRIFPEWLAQEALALHRDNNRRLAELTQLDLAQYEYC